MILRASLVCSLCISIGAAEPSREAVRAALLHGARFFREEVAVQGTYLWQYSADLAKREGEGKASTTQGWVQPPGTPAVGMAFLEAWNATHDAYFLEAARESARALIRGQLRSGGWQHSLEFDSKLRKRFAYRQGGGEKGRNVTTFDDDSTQAALRFLMRSDAALNFGDSTIREAIRHALQSVLKAQYPNGAWPQGYDRFPAPEQFPVKPAAYPAEWPRTWPGSQNYWERYTLNDNNLATLVETLFEGARLYETAADPVFAELSKQCRSAAERAGDFLILAQMPEPQPAWAQQYDFDMHPSWARKFEPPAIAAGESQGALRTLLKVYRETGKAKYLEPIPAALAYLRGSRLPEGQLARFYELRSNKPLYFTREYDLTYDDSDVPTHYSFKVSDDTSAIGGEFDMLRKLPKSELQQTRRSKPPAADEVRKILAAQDEQGRWIEEGKLRYHGPNDPTIEVIRCATFARNMQTLARYLSARERQP